MSIQMRWLGKAGFEIVTPSGKTIIIDPYMTGSFEPPIQWDEIQGCDYIFITHGHFDHVSDVGNLAGKFTPKIFCNKTTADALMEHQNVDPKLFSCITAGDVITHGDLSVNVVEGVHADVSNPEDIPEIEGVDVGKSIKDYPPGEQLNFIFDVEGGNRIYMAGSFPDPSLLTVAEKARADIILLQVMMGKKLVGLERATFEMAKASGSKIVIPQHHDRMGKNSTTTDLKELKEIFSTESDMEFKELEAGEWYTFNIPSIS